MKQKKSKLKKKIKKSNENLGFLLSFKRKKNGIFFVKKYNINFLKVDIKILNFFSKNYISKTYFLKISAKNICKAEYLYFYQKIVPAWTTLSNTPKKMFEKLCFFDGQKLGFKISYSLFWFFLVKI